MGLLINLAVPLMTLRTYRFLLVGSLVLGFVSFLFDALFPSAILTVILQAKLAAQVGSHSIAFTLFRGGAALLLIVGYITSFVGLYLLRPWAPRFTLVITALGIFVLSPSSVSASSGWADAFAELSSMLLGAVLAITYFSSLSEHFTRAKPLTLRSRGKLRRVPKLRR